MSRAGLIDSSQLLLHPSLHNIVLKQGASRGAEGREKKTVKKGECRLEDTFRRTCPLFARRGGRGGKGQAGQAGQARVVEGLGLATRRREIGAIRARRNTVALAGGCARRAAFP